MACTEREKQNKNKDDMEQKLNLLDTNRRISKTSFYKLLTYTCVEV